MSVLDQQVYSNAFKEECNPLHNQFDSSSPSLHREKVNSFKITELQAHFYYHGLRKSELFGPKLIYTTSKVFPLPGSFNNVRTVQLLTVHKHPKLSQNNLWDSIRDEIAEILDREKIQYTSIDLVRFCWVKRKFNSRKTGYSPVTIWIGVRPTSTTGDVAFCTAEDISTLLEAHGVDDLDIAFRESETHQFSCSGPILYAPVRNSHPLKRVIDWVTTSLGSPIAGVTTPHIEGTLGFYFKDGEELYGVTARHVIFPTQEGNRSYDAETSTPSKDEKKYVALMGTQAFKNLVASVEAYIKELTSYATLWERNLANPEASEMKEKNQQNLDITLERVSEVKKFLGTLKDDWSDIKNRIIGHVVWSPPISGQNAFNGPSGYMRDVCVIKLDTNKFMPNVLGNAIQLGNEFKLVEFLSKLYPQTEIPAGFKCPVLNDLYFLKDILASADIKEPNIKSKNGNLTRFVSKRGFSTGTTIGCLNGFLSRTRRYTPIGTFDSIDTAVLSYDDESGMFSRGGDSGAAIVGSNNEFVAMLNGGAGTSKDCDITYGTPMQWLWNNVIKPEFPDAILFFDSK